MGIKIIGISCFYHDSAVSLVEDGKVEFAIQEERLTRLKHDKSFPKYGLKNCLKYLNIKPEEIDYVVFYDKPLLKFERLIETSLTFFPKGLNLFKNYFPIWIKEKVFIKQIIFNELQLLGFDKKLKKKIFFSNHHLSHAASAFYPSIFNDSAIITLDGVGEWNTSSIALGKGNKITTLKTIDYPHSLGLLYSAFTQLLGFKVNSDEYKMMGLAPYGNPVYLDLIENEILQSNQDGSFFLNQDYFSFNYKEMMISEKFNNLFKIEKRNMKDKITQKHADIASSIQKVLEKIILKIVFHARNITNQNNLCLAGGVALNCVANGVLQKEKVFEKIWIQPAATDSGGSLGAALSFYYDGLNQKRIVYKNEESMNYGYLGQEFSDIEVENSLKNFKINYRKLTDKELINFTSKMILKNKYFGWFQGRSEFGPRALGCRSILANPISPNTQKDLNLKIKFRESFRPFAPIILEEELSRLFDQNDPSPYMLFVYKINKKISPIQSGINSINEIRSELPAITHVDYSARIQTINEKSNLKMFNLLKKYKELTGYGVLVNTSFNVSDEPIVNSPYDAIKCFFESGLDFLVINNYIIDKVEQAEHLTTSLR
jgi:carbamoyltransferase